MLRVCILILIVVLIVVLGGSSLGSVAQAAERRVDVADVLVAAAWDASTCDVRVYRRRTGDVNLVCNEGGFAAIMLKVPLFPGANDDGVIRRIRLNDSGSTENCVGESPTDARVHDGYLRLIYSNSYDEIGTFDCWYRSLRIRYRIA